VSLQGPPKKRGGEGLRNAINEGKNRSWSPVELETGWCCDGFVLEFIFMFQVEQYFKYC